MNYGNKKIDTRRLVAGRELTVVICGSFRRHPEQLQSEFRQLEEAGCKVLSPLSPHFAAEEKGFVFGSSEIGKDPALIEQGHLGAMKKADFVWLHCPDGYVGTSAAIELGFAEALGLRVFAGEEPDDVTVGGLVELRSSPRAAAAEVEAERGEAPAGALVSLQSYYERASWERGWSAESATETVDHIREEVDELESALGKAVAPDENVAHELADVLLYVVHMANVLGLDLAEAVRVKEHLNAARFDPLPERLAS